MQHVSTSLQWLTRGDPKGINVPLLGPPLLVFAVQDDQFMYRQYMSLLFSILPIENIRIQVNKGYL